MPIPPPPPKVTVKDTGALVATRRAINFIGATVSDDPANNEVDVTVGSVTVATYQQVVTVAKNGGDYTTIQDAIDSISDNSSTKRYLVLVHPGKYAEQVTMKTYVDVRGVDRMAVQIEYGATTGAIILADNCEVSNLTIENSATEGHWGIVGSNTSGVHIRHVSMLAPFVGTNRGAGIKLTGTSWQTALIEHVIINSYTQTNQGIFIQSDGVDLVDCTLNDVFVDALASTTGGAVLLDGVLDTHLRNVYSRISSDGYGLRVISGSIVDATSCYFEAGTQSIELDATSTLYLVGTPITNSSVTAGGALVGFGRGVMLVRSTNQSITTATDTAISWSSASVEHVSRYGDWWASGSATRFTANYHGWYNLSTTVWWATSATGARYVHLKKNGTDWIANDSRAAMASGQTFQPVSVSVYLAAGDYVEVVVRQESGGSINVTQAMFTGVHWF